MDLFLRFALVFIIFLIIYPFSAGVLVHSGEHGFSFSSILTGVFMVAASLFGMVILLILIQLMDAYRGVRRLHNNTTSGPIEGLSWMFFEEHSTSTFPHFVAKRIPDYINNNPEINKGITNWRLPSREEVKALTKSEYSPKFGEYWLADHCEDPDMRWSVLLSERRTFIDRIHEMKSKSLLSLGARVILVGGEMS
jgi:hypothetical protein